MRQLEKIKEMFTGLSKGTRGMLVTAAVGLLIFSAVMAVVLNHKEYSTLFVDLNDTEAQEVVAKLQESGVDYQYKEDGKIMVPSDKVDQTRGVLAMEGYPKSGFAYDTFINNSGLMSTESDKETYKIYDLQNRIGATIRTLDGVKSAVVTINPAETKKYVLDNSETAKASASAVIEMYSGGSPSTQQVEAIQRLIAKGVAGLELGDVVVLDGNGIDVSVVRDDEDGTRAANKKSEYEKTMEAQIEGNVVKVLAPLYGEENIRVAVKCTADMQKVISEEINYSAPNTENNSGYISRQELNSEGTGAGAGAAGVPGAESNTTNVPQYNTQGAAGSGYSYGSSATDYELNQKKVQGQNDGGTITDTSIAVTINSKAGTVDKNLLIPQIARAAGVAPEVQDQKISVVSADFFQYIEPEETVPAVTDPEQAAVKNPLEQYLPFIIAGCVALILILTLVIVLIRRKSKKKKAAAEQAALLAAAQVQAMGINQEDQEVIPEIPEMEEMLPIKNERGVKLKENIREFSNENPEISAALLKSWLRGGEENG